MVDSDERQLSASSFYLSAFGQMNGRANFIFASGGRATDGEGGADDVDY
jgi:hypothetical protein